MGRGWLVDRGRASKGVRGEAGDRGQNVVRRFDGAMGNVKQWGWGRTIVALEAV